MGYIIEPKNVDFVVAPSVLTDDAKLKIAQAISKYKQTGEKPVSVQIISQGSVSVSTYLNRTKAIGTDTNPNVRRKAKI